MQPKDRQAADDNLNHVGYELLTEERFGLACKIFDFAAKTLKQYASERKARVFTVNRAQAYKWAGDPETTKEILSSEDWSAASDDLKLAERVLLDDFDAANTLVRKVGVNDPMQKAYYRDWPLFR